MLTVWGKGRDSYLDLPWEGGNHCLGMSNTCLTERMRLLKQKWSGASAHLAGCSCNPPGNLEQTWGAFTWYPSAVGLQEISFHSLMSVTHSRQLDLYNEKGSMYCLTRLVLILRVQTGCFSQRPTPYCMNIKCKTLLCASVMENSFYCTKLYGLQWRKAQL